MNDFDRTKAIMMLKTKVSGSGYCIIVSDNDQTIDNLIMDFSEQVSKELKDLKVAVFDYAKDVQIEGRYNNDRVKCSYASWAMDYYMADNNLEDEGLRNVVAIYRHLDNFVLEGVTAEDKMQRLAQYLGFQNMFREANSYYKTAYYVFPTWLFSLILQNCADFRSQISDTFVLDSNFPAICTADDCRPDWFNYERFNELFWPSFHKK